MNFDGILAQVDGKYASLTEDREWVAEAVKKIAADQHRSADTHLIKLPLPAFPNVDLYLKDESTHITGSLKHRLARSLFLYGLCNGSIHQNTVIVEASSGSTAISEAYFARLLGLRFIAVVPNGTTREKLASIQHYGGEIAFTESGNIYSEAQRIAEQNNGHYMDQFTYAERVTDWRGNNNIAESLFQQMQAEPHPCPSWVVVGAGTGGTSATIGRFIRYKADVYQETKLCVADPQGSAFFKALQKNCTEALRQSRIEGVGRPRQEPSFIPDVVDLMVKVNDSASIATSIWLEQFLNRKCGGSTGLNLYAALYLAQQMQARGEVGSIVTLICDDGNRYLDNVHDAQWRAENDINIAPYLDALNALSEPT